MQVNFAGPSPRGVGQEHNRSLEPLGLVKIHHLHDRGGRLFLSLLGHHQRSAVALFGAVHQGVQSRKQVGGRAVHGTAAQQFQRLAERSGSRGADRRRVGCQPAVIRNALDGHRQGQSREPPLAAFDPFKGILQRFRLLIAATL